MRVSLECLSQWTFHPHICFDRYLRSPQQLSYRYYIQTDPEHLARLSGLTHSNALGGELGTLETGGGATEPQSGGSSVGWPVCADAPRGGLAVRGSPDPAQADHMEAAISMRRSRIRRSPSLSRLGRKPHAIVSSRSDVCLPHRARHRPRRRCGLGEMPINGCPTARPPEVRGPCAWGWPTGVNGDLRH
jgi:hypothetical protein